MRSARSVSAGIILCSWSLQAGDLRLPDNQPLNLPAPGSYELRELAPDVLELTYVTASALSGKTSARTWEFVNGAGGLKLPASNQLSVVASGQPFAIKAIGFKRSVAYAPLAKWDLRVANQLYLVLENPVQDGQVIEVKNPTHDLWGADLRFNCRADPLRWSPVLHVNQTGYLPNFPKKAMIGFYLGSLGELDVERAVGGRTGAAPFKTTQGGLAFEVITADSAKPVYQGVLKRRPDQGFPFECYRDVYEADFSSVKQPGEYRLWVPGLGTSFPFRIGTDVAGAFARAYALGIYHQRCGTSNCLPFTRFTHGPCHTAPADVPDMTPKYAFVNECLGKMTADYKDNPRHTAPQLKDVRSCLYPFVNRGPVDVRGGHHDAGDYSKYTINSAAFIHHLVFAADAFPGVAALDNLGLPESGDGKSDVLEEAKWEADFLVKMQDADGGFYFLVYPRDREYENDVLPDKGDRQVVFPKTTAVTAAATAALAQCASSPAFKREFPQAAAGYLAAARKGWDFLDKAIQKYGKDGSYQKITHYGNEFMHDDELTWAACELFLATGDEGFHKKVIEWLKPSDPGTRRWGWWRLYDSYGCAIRSYAFAARTGRLKREQLNQFLLEDCENEIASAGEDQLRRAQNCAYGTSFPDETKRALSAGWYFSGDAAFDLAVACQLDYPVNRDPRQDMKEALISNLNYEQGCNPVNVTYLTGLGWHRQREIVDQYALNDRRILPPTGVPLGNVQAGFGWNYIYENEPDKLIFPLTSTDSAPYPFYDRWGDGFNLSQEFVIVNQARALAYLSWLMAQTPLKDQPWRAAEAQISEHPAGDAARHKLSLSLSSAGIDLRDARIVWEAEGQEPHLGNTFTVPGAGCHWIEAEAQLPDGRRIFSVKESGTSARGAGN